jgi:EF hand
MRIPEAWILAFLTAASASAADPGADAPSDVFVARRLELLPQLQTPAIYPVRFPLQSPARTIRSMVWCEGKLWISAQTVDAPPPGERQGRLWSFEPTANRLQRVGGVLEENWTVSLMASDSHLWLAMDGGVCDVELRGNHLEAYGSFRGVNAATVTGVGMVADSVVALGSAGTEFILRPGETNFVEVAKPPAAELGAGETVWGGFATSGSWSLAASESRVAVRQPSSTRWSSTGPDLFRGSPREGPGRLFCAEGDGDGGFWLGSDVGLHHLKAETMAVETRFAPVSVRVASGYEAPASPWFKVGEEAKRQARTRIAAGIRDRMKDRARRARMGGADRANLSPIWPTSRLPAGVTALLRDHDSLWIATFDGWNTQRGRLLLYHPQSRRWVGWTPLPRPARCLAASDRLVFVGMDTSGDAREAPVAAIEKTPLISVPPARWTPDAVSGEEVAGKLAALPAKERAVYHFFGGSAREVSEILAPEGNLPANADAETLFLLAFSNDAAGAGDPPALLRWGRELEARFPGDIVAEVAAPALASSVTESPAAAPVGSTAAGDEPESAADVMLRRDLDGDGRINPVEFKLWRGPDADFKAADLNGDGFLEPVEVEALLKRK